MKISIDVRYQLIIYQCPENVKIYLDALKFGKHPVKVGRVTTVIFCAREGGFIFEIGFLGFPDIYPTSILKISVAIMWQIFLIRNHPFFETPCRCSVYPCTAVMYGLLSWQRPGRGCRLSSDCFCEYHKYNKYNNYHGPQTMQTDGAAVVATPGQMRYLQSTDTDSYYIYCWLKILDIKCVECGRHISLLLCHLRHNWCTLMQNANNAENTVQHGENLLNLSTTVQNLYNGGGEVGCCCC